MAKTLKEEAQEYIPMQTKNIADLDKVSVNIQLEDGEGTDSKGETFKYKFFVLDKESYRVPNIVIGQIKLILAANPNVQHVVVTKQGTGIGTTYMTMPYVEPVQAEQVPPN
ncbi:unnamed protein product [marine sediment metagenome]|uniref:Uncharacterized protein n=1 Tax=marine sediment metagenome TaxID=412755 RepID=X1ACA6_9ZZZZ